MPDEGLPKSIAAPSLLAEIAVRKYADHQPLDRLVKTFRRHGVELSKASMCRWMQEIGQMVQPLLALMKRRMLEHSLILGHDDTPVRQAAPEPRRDRRRLPHDPCSLGWLPLPSPRPAAGQHRPVARHGSPDRHRAGLRTCP